MSRLDQAVALAGLVLLGIGAVFPPDSPAWIRVVLAGIGIGAAVLSIIRGKGAGAPVALVTGFLLLVLAAGVFWQLAMPIALGGYFLVAKLVPSIQTRGWWNKGNVPFLPTALCAAVTPVALVSWVVFLNPDISDLLHLVPDASLPILLAGGIVFAFVNAAGEELIWRGLFQDRLSVLFGPIAAIAVQGVSFGVQHAYGFPRGVVGVFLVVIWGLMLGWLRKRTGGILAPIVAHVVADATIAGIVIFMARR